MEKPSLTVRQATMWFTLSQLGSALLILPASLANIAKQDAWLAIFVALAGYLLMSPLHIALARQMNGRSFVDYVSFIMGNVLGRSIALLFVVAFSFLLFMLVLRDIGDFVATSVLPETPTEAIYALILVAVIYAVRSGVTVTGRAAELLFWAVMLLLTISIAALVPTIQLDNIKPVLEFGFKPVVHASILLIAFPFLESVLYLFFVPDFQNAKQWTSTVLRSSIICGTLFCIVTFCNIATLSSKVTANLTYPSYFVIRTISFADIFERFEILIAVLWYISIFFRLSMILQAVKTGLSGIFRLHDGRALLIPLGLISFATAQSIFPNYAEVIHSFEFWPYYVFVFSLLFPAVLLTIGKMRGSGQADSN
ncbi:GerAB/ArcD/ProY family transporter [Paenibacillus kobensis]|uniref:GerAB/ArcD/ProY family transporter n=1 Tax=Paenibacillus kobensis TaxID=59841 RepID=UPI000FDBA615|nr:endospore germination permease [Paenibacillus kobensis]